MKVKFFTVNQRLLPVCKTQSFSMWTSIFVISFSVNVPFFINIKKKFWTKFLAHCKNRQVDHVGVPTGQTTIVKSAPTCCVVTPSRLQIIRFKFVIHSVLVTHLISQVNPFLRREVTSFLGEASHALYE